MRLPWETKADLRNRVAELEAQIERMDKINTAVSLLRAGAEPDRSFMLELQSELWPLLAQTLFVWFQENGGKNYIEQKVSFQKEDADRKASLTFKAFDGPIPELFTLTLQRKSGLTPHEARVRVEKERDLLKRALIDLGIAEEFIDKELTAIHAK